MTAAAFSHTHHVPPELRSSLPTLRPLASESRSSSPFPTSPVPTRSVESNFARNYNAPLARPWKLSLLPTEVQELIKPVIPAQRSEEFLKDFSEYDTFVDSEYRYHEDRSLHFQGVDSEGGEYQLHCTYKTRDERLTTLFKRTCLAPVEKEVHYFESYLPLFEEDRDESYKLPPTAQNLESLVKDEHFDLIHKELTRHLESEDSDKSNISIDFSSLRVFTDWRFQQRSIEVQHKLESSQSDTSLHYFIKSSSAPLPFHLAEGEERALNPEEDKGQAKPSALLHRNIQWIREQNPLVALSGIGLVARFYFNEQRIFTATFALLAMIHLIDKSLETFLPLAEKKKHIPLLKARKEQVSKALTSFENILAMAGGLYASLFLVNQTDNASFLSYGLGLITLLEAAYAGKVWYTSHKGAGNSPAKLQGLIKDVQDQSFKSFENLQHSLQSSIGNFCNCVTTGNYSQALQLFPLPSSPELNIVLSIQGAQHLMQNAPSPLQLVIPPACLAYYFFQNKRPNPLLLAAAPVAANYFSSSDLTSFLQLNTSFALSGLALAVGATRLLESTHTQQSVKACKSIYSQFLETTQETQDEKVIKHLKAHMKEINLCEEGDEDESFKVFFEAFSKSLSSEPSYSPASSEDSMSSDGSFSDTESMGESSKDPALLELMQKHARIWALGQVSDKSGNVKTFINLFTSLGIDPKRIENKEDKKRYFQELVNLSLGQGNFQRSVDSIRKLWPLHLKLQNHKSYVSEFIASTVKETKNYIYGSISPFISQYARPISPSLEPSGPISAALTCLCYFGLTQYFSPKLLNQYEFYRSIKKKSVFKNAFSIIDATIATYYAMRITANFIDYQNGSKDWLSILKEDMDKWIPSLKPYVHAPSTLIKKSLPKNLQDYWQTFENYILMLVHPEEVPEFIISLVVTFMSGSAVNDAIDILVKNPFLQKLIDAKDKNTLKSFVSYLPIVYIVSRFCINFINKNPSFIQNLKNKTEKNYQTFTRRRQMAIQIIERDFDNEVISKLAVSCILGFSTASIVKLSLLDRISCFKSGLPAFLKTLFMVLPSTYYVCNYLVKVYEEIRRNEQR